MITADMETNGLRPSRLFMIGVQDLLSGEYKSFVGLDEVCEALFRISTETKMVVGHNFRGYDAKVAKDLAGVDIDPEVILDTCDMSRDLCKLRNHKLETWGEIMGLPKLRQPLFEEYSEEMDDYCQRDVRLNTAAFGFMYRLYLGTERSSLKFNYGVLERHRDMINRSIIG